MTGGIGQFWFYTNKRVDFKINTKSHKYSNDNKPLILQCGHEYKTKNAQRWILRFNVCPKCEYIQKKLNC